jgi:hypothetical protein
LKEDTTMQRRLQALITLPFILATIYAVSLAAQQTVGQAESANRIQGTITTGLSTQDFGMPSFTLKTSDGTEYVIHLGTLKNAAGEVFAPKVGDSIAVAGSSCCGMGAQAQIQKMIHAAEITLGNETFRAAGAPGCMMMSGGMQGMMGPMGQGQPGQGMMMRQGTPSPVQPGQGMQGMQGMMMCPGMTGQTMPGHNMPGQGQPGTDATAPATTGCCSGMATGAGCAGCAQQQPPAAAPEPAPQPEHVH